MKIKLFSFVTLLLLSVAISAQSQSYKKLWDKVSSLEKKDLPTSVIKVTEQIYNKARKENNLGEALKAYQLRMKYREELSPDSFYIDLKQLETWTNNELNPLDKTVLHSVLAEVYLRAFDNLVYKIPLQAATTSIAPIDIRQWTKKDFIECILKSIRLSMAEPTMQQNTSSTRFEPLAVIEPTSKYFHHSLFDLLGRRTISLLNRLYYLTVDTYPQTKRSITPEMTEVNEFVKHHYIPASSYDIVAESFSIYQTMLAYYLKTDNRAAVVLTDLDLFKYATNHNESALYIKALDNLIGKYSSTPVCAEVYLAKANYFRQEKENLNALETIRLGIARYPRYDRVKALQMIEEELLNPSLRVSFPKTIYPGIDYQLNASHVNESGFTLEYYLVDATAIALPTHAKPIKKQHLSLLKPKDLLEADTIINLCAPEVGKYMVRIVPDSKAELDKPRILYVSRLRSIARRYPNSSAEVIIVDNESGKPIPDVTVQFFLNEQKESKRVAEILSNKMGKVLSPDIKDISTFSFSKENDPGSGSDRLPYNYYSNSTQKREERTYLITDRSIYRPGQTVKVKGIVYTQLLDSAHAVANKEDSLVLKDANYQQIDEKKVTTNEFGSFTTEFVLPTSCLNGNFSIANKYGNAYFTVADYKRPSFDISFQPQTASYRLGDSLQVRGSVKTFSGVPLSGVKANYTITRVPILIGRWIRWAKPSIINSGEQILNEQGNFDISFILSASQDREKQYYYYKVEVTVTNLAGETQTSETSITAGSKSMYFLCDLPDKVCKERLPITTIKAFNLEQQAITLDGEYQVLHLPDSVSVCKGKFTTDKPLSLSVMNTLANGEYLLRYQGIDSRRDSISDENKFILFSLEDKKPPITTPNWFVLLDKTFTSKKPATMLFGSSEKDVYAIIDFYVNNKRSITHYLHLSDTVRKIAIPNPVGSQAVNVQTTFIKHGKAYQNEARVELELPSKELNLKWDVFRDKLRPGQEEEWKLTINRPDGKPADAEFLAMMYDASLDKLSPSRFPDLNNLAKYVPATWILNRDISDIYTIWESFNYPIRKLKYPTLNYDYFVKQDYFAPKEISFEYSSNNITRVRGKLKPNKQVMVVNAAAQQRTEESAPVTIRKNFEETAFFYPQLRTNEQGQIAFSFTMPQSLTSWQFYGLATTKEMMSGKLEAVATTSKEFMLVPNMPRFVRVGDKSTIAASIINLSKEQVNGEASMELFNPETEEVIYTQSQKFAVKADSTIAVNFAFTANESSSLLGCRIIAKASRFSDGEQRLLPVLTNKEWITESVPMTIRGAETRKFSLKGLFNHQSATATNRRLTVEFASNPAWYAVQALPTLSNPVSDNAISWAAAYYANSLASYIVNSQPRLKTVFDTWKSQNATKETLWSNLQKNEELKNILLQETPWVMEATTEAEQKQRLSLLFDLNTIQSNNATALDKLGKLQNSNGSWSWCTGMSGSKYTTSFVLESLCKLSVITGEPLSADALAMQKKAFDYLHAQVAEDYKTEQKLKEKTSTISGSTLTYLYLCSLTSDIIPAGNRKAYLYYIEKLPRVIRSLTLREKALAAIILEKATKKAEATDFINSIKEYALTTDEMTRYRISTQVNVLEALQQAGNNEQAVEDIKLWLLKEKRTQTWESPIATVNAVYALLTNGSDLLANSEQAKITLGKQKIPLTADYTKETFSGKSLKPDMTNITVEKRSKGIAWGAVYAQYLEDMSKVSSDSSQALSIDKQMYVERTVNNQTERTPIKDLKYLQIGDKLLVRLILTVGRNMDFVQLKDERAACLEPLNSLSGYQFGSNVGYYQSVEDASTAYFFDELRKGTYLLESSFYVNRAGQYSSGIATLQSAYAPEFVAHTTSTELIVK